jgi:cyclopropane fatty-acyl-phospholipid synthase-like methyltransferase
MAIEYLHAANTHTLSGPQAALSVLFERGKISSLLDVGCGTGTWMRAALDFGIPDVYGVDGVQVPPEQLHVPVEKIRYQDLTRSWNLNRQFDAVICLEVAEHLDGASAGVLIDALVRHGDHIYFSAGCPGQPGQNHVNCRWPEYWQRLFNEHGYVCDDHLRWRMWDNSQIEPWYRQNLFLAHRDPKMAGQESRIKSVVHPGIWEPTINQMAAATFEKCLRDIEDGRMPFIWNLTMPGRAFCAKLKRRLT